MVELLQSDLNNISNSLVWIFVLRLFDQTISQQCEHFILCDKPVAVQVVNPETVGHFLLLTSPQEGVAVNEVTAIKFLFSKEDKLVDLQSHDPSLQSNGKSFVALLPGTENPLHNQFFGNDVESGVQKFPEDCSINTLQIMK